MKPVSAVYVAIALACCVCPPQLNAADKQTPPAAAKLTAAPNSDAAWTRRVPEFFSDNLPLGEVVGQLRKLFPELNFLTRNGLSTGSDPVEIDSVSIRFMLHNVTLEEILKATALAADRSIRIEGSPQDRLIVFQPGELSGPPEVITVVTRAYNLSDYLAGMAEKDADVAMQELYAALELAGKMMTDASRGKRRFAPQIKMHRGTKLLIAVGRPDELEIVEQIAGQLQLHSGHRGKSGQESSGPRANPKLSAPSQSSR